MHLPRIHKVEHILEKYGAGNTYGLILCYLELFCKNNFPFKQVWKKIYQKNENWNMTIS